MSVWKKSGFLLCFIIPGLVIAGFYLGGVWNFLSLLQVFVLVPLIDRWVGLDTVNVPQEQKHDVEETFYFRAITYAWALFQMLFVVWGCYVIVTQPPAGIGLAGFVIGFSLVTGGIGITVAHELGHKRSKLERFYSRMLLMTVCYMHFYTEHNEGHHVWVATPEDPATARRNQNFYGFWVQSVFIGFAHARHLCAEKLARRGQSVWHLSNPMYGYIFWPLVFCGVLTATAIAYLDAPWWTVPAFFTTQSILGFTLLELVNYVEHYGILRQRLPDGRYERINPLHSWNTSHRISNYFLFQLQRHSDHHYLAAKRYQVLDHHDRSPQLPFGYPTMILTALLPPLWFRMMNPRLAAWEAGRIPRPQEG